ncbi:MAG: AAA family ATPase, partial [Deltaproteobacteria bacterium]|nr:AAA family ATPase [Deltaproteobacteria bacterium]
MNFYGRKEEIRIISKWIQSSNAELCHVRGRRRIGKTSILEKITKKFEAFYFSGFADESDLNCRTRIAEDWDKYTGIQDLSTRNKEYKSWKNIFLYITNYSKDNETKKIILIFDEIQWLAKKGAGILGLLKREWEKNWQHLENVKVILAGSSSKFFLNQVDNFKGALYGLRTVSDLIIQPFTIDEVNQYYSKQANWT